MTEYLIERKDGTKLTVRKNKTHYFALDAKGQPVGPARVALESLLEALDASIVGEPAGVSPAPPEFAPAPEKEAETPEQMHEELAKETPAADDGGKGPDEPEGD